MSTSKSILRILLVYKVKYVQNVLGYRLLKEEIALGMWQRRENYISHNASYPEGSEALPVIPYRPEAGSLVLFPILQGKNGGASLQDSISGSPILRHPNQEGIKWTPAGVGHARGQLRALLDASFVSPGFARGTKWVRWGAKEAPELPAACHSSGLELQDPSADP